MINSLERVLGTIRRKPVDRIARGEIHIENTVISDALGCARLGFEERLRFTSLFGLDIYCLSPSVASQKGRLPLPGEFEWPDLRAWVDRSGLFIFAILDGPFGWGLRTFGFRDFFTMSMSDPDKLADFQKEIERLNGALASRLAGDGIHGLILADDIAYSNGLFVGPTAMREHFFPSLARQAEQMLSLGPFLFFHSDGNFMDLLPEIAAMGFHGFHCIDPGSGMDSMEMRSRVGPELCLWGTLTSKDLEKFAADPAERDTALKKITAEASAGGYILGTTSGLFKGLEIAGLRSLYDEI